ncbi:hypothetical protein EIN_031610 [Entamoeba invadens IP1]|uniref:Rab-GAP TBC domain-containing protein n=1 Tax=Entamoeba invadens IP1 TaxID=370355 RepID=A0A0A1TY70_ENTIV|nr:hypothetical protein EIN_031610 [Entamoeba invadens IP1]ELP86440.1 hypothetical protein EIN_031610 [Entamoeba invadens IP1]|eukprot:XP_004185786.1 hypothetical protein EIN_031610 [Entamoeba invadens IP1]
MSDDTCLPIQIFKQIHHVTIIQNPDIRSIKGSLLIFPDSEKTNFTFQPRHHEKHPFAVVISQDNVKRVIIEHNKDTLSNEAFFFFFDESKFRATEFVFKKQTEFEVFLELFKKNWNNLILVDSYDEKMIFESKHVSFEFGENVDYNKLVEDFKTSQTNDFLPVTKDNTKTTRRFKSQRGIPPLKLPDEKPEEMAEMNSRSLSMSVPKTTRGERNKEFDAEDKHVLKNVTELCINPVKKDEANIPIDKLRQMVGYYGVDQSIRTETWRKLFNYKYKDTYWSALAYVDMMNQFNTPTWQVLKYKLSKDLPRTEVNGIFIKPETEMWKKMERLFLAFVAMRQISLFIQGLLEIFSVIVSFEKREDVAFELICNVMELVIPCGYEHHDEWKSLILSRFMKILQYSNQKIYHLLTSFKMEFWFVWKWIVLLFKREFEQPQLLLIWDRFVAFPERQMSLFLVVSIINYHSDDILKKNMGFDDFCVYLEMLPKPFPSELIIEADLLHKQFVMLAPPDIQKEVFENIPMLYADETPLYIQLHTTFLNLSDDKKDQVVNKIGICPHFSIVQPDATTEEILKRIDEQVAFHIWIREFKKFLTTNPSF